MICSRLEDCRLIILDMLSHADTLHRITSGLYINIILIDYVRTILNLNRSNSPWRLDPRENLEVYGPSNIPEGELHGLKM